MVTQSSKTRQESSAYPKAKGHFVLVHGACHGAWCWYKLIPLLRNAGHTVTAIDLPASDIHPHDADQIRTWAEMNQPLVHFFHSLLPHQKVILVGHSMSGMNLSLMMEQFPLQICVAVFVTAFMPLTGTSATEMVSDVGDRIGSWGDTEFIHGQGPHNPPTAFIFGANFLRQTLYQNSPPEDIALGEMLLRRFPLIEENVVFTEERYGSVRRVFVVAKDDKGIREELQRKMIIDNLYEMDDSDHMPFFSNPIRLAHILDEISTIYG